MWKFGVNSDPRLYTQYNFFNFLMLSIKEASREWFLAEKYLVKINPSYFENKMERKHCNAKSIIINISEYFSRYTHFLLLQIETLILILIQNCT